MGILFRQTKLKKAKNYLRRVIFSQFALFMIGLILLLAVSYPTFKNITRQYHTNQEIKELEKEISDLENKKLHLNSLIEYLGSDEFTEEQARLNLNLKKPGEEVVVIAPEGESVIAATASPPGTVFSLPGAEQKTAVTKTGNPQKWWQYFFISSSGNN